MASRDPVEPARLVRVVPAAAEEQVGVLVLQRTERHALEEVLPAEPGGHRRLTPDQHESHALVECRHEDLAQPGVHEAEDLEVVECEHHRLAERAEPVRGRLGIPVVAPQRLEQSRFGRLDRAAVELDGDGPGGAHAVDEDVDERRLADAGVAVDVHHAGFAARPDQGFEQLQLGIAAHEGALHAVGEHGAEPLGDAHLSKPPTEYPPFGGARLRSPAARSV